METAFTLVVVFATLFGVADFVIFGSIGTAVVEAFSVLGFGWSTLIVLDMINDRLRKHYTNENR